MHPPHDAFHAPAKHPEMGLQEHDQGGHDATLTSESVQRCILSE